MQKLNQLIELIRKLSVILLVDLDNLVVGLPPGIAYTSDATSTRSISDETIQKLVVIVNSLTEEKKMRLQKVTFYVCYAVLDLSIFRGCTANCFFIYVKLLIFIFNVALAMVISV